MLKQLIKAVTWPYRSGMEFVDKRPSINTVRQHLNQVEPIVVARADGAFEVQLAASGMRDEKGNPLVIPNGTLAVMSADGGPQDLVQNREAAESFAKGFCKARSMVNDARISTAHAQNKFLSAEARKQKAAAKAAEAADGHVEYVPEMGTARAGI